MSELSLNELKALVRKAARGAGLPWGLADDAAWAVSWLEARGFQGAAMLDTWFQHDAGVGACLSCPAAPVVVDGHWQAPEGPLCPIVMGTALADRTELEVFLGPTARPLLLAPFAATLAAKTRQQLELSWEGALVSLAVDGEGWRADGPALDVNIADKVVLFPATSAVQPGPVRPRRPRLSPALVGRLEALAARTYAPVEADRDTAGSGPPP